MDLFHTYCHCCHQKAHCKPLSWQDIPGVSNWNVRLYCPECHPKEEAKLRKRGLKK